LEEKATKTESAAMYLMGSSFQVSDEVSLGLNFGRSTASVFRRR
jgi:hypothetical protein